MNRHSQHSQIRQGSLLITGAAKRVGKALAIALATEGWDIHLHFRDSEQDAIATAKIITDMDRQVTLHQADLADEQACENLIRDCLTDDHLAGVVNNASLFSYDDSDDFTASGFHKHMAVNAIAPAIIMRELAAAMKSRQKKAAVVNITDAKLVGLNPDYYTYTVSKMALDGLTKMAAQAYAPWLRVNAIAPGITLRSGDQTDEEYHIAHAFNPLGRGAECDDIIRLAKMILDTPSMTGHTIVVDGGLHLRPPNRDVAFLDKQDLT
ncbi:MAG: SDR family oxidoreductase [Candidatus Puniceispirillales bacterium]